MKTIITKNLFALSFIALMLALGACSKYEDGPWISFRSVEDRIIGKWKVEYFEIDGVDVTQQWIDNYDWSFEFYIDEYYGTHKMWIWDISCTTTTDTLISYASSGWKLHNNDTKLGFGILNMMSPPTDTIYCGMYPLETYRVSIYTIIRLTKKNMWLSHENDGHNYLIKLRII